MPERYQLILSRTKVRTSRGEVGGRDAIHSGKRRLEAEVQSVDRRWYSMRIMPYRTTDNRIDWAVLTFSNSDDQKGARELLKVGSLEMEQAQAPARGVFNMNPAPWR
ncbi:MAG: PAS domain-containing protein [Syntrophobacteraceae bacterium]|nr:PAS domain-containing protein [Syntrophobacteraceae bacterium]